MKRIILYLKEKITIDLDLSIEVLPEVLLDKDSGRVFVLEDNHPARDEGEPTYFEVNCDSISLYNQSSTKIRGIQL